MREWWRDLTDLVLPAECGGCGRARSVLCPGCRTALSGAPPRIDSRFNIAEYFLPMAVII
ncbi:DUF3043 domain-containing protein, partial [Streptomyces geysiriensis]|nr:DUF3043 domain-containing protein [Streptomyces geysiriensis]